MINSIAKNIQVAIQSPYTSLSASSNSVEVFDVLSGNPTKTFSS